MLVGQLADALPIPVQAVEEEEVSSLLPKGREDGMFDSRNGKESGRAVIFTVSVSTLGAQVDVHETLKCNTPSPQSACAAYGRK
jgi:hypothetical protein